MEAKTIKLSDLHLNTGQIKDVPKNPRFIRHERFKALKKSIKDNPEMLNIRELVAYDNDGELVLIMGNMRYRAMKDLGFKDAPVFTPYIPKNEMETLQLINLSTQSKQTMSQEDGIRLNPLVSNPAETLKQIQKE